MIYKPIKGSKKLNSKDVLFSLRPLWCHVVDLQSTDFVIVLQAVEDRLHSVLQFKCLQDQVHDDEEEWRE